MATAVRLLGSAAVLGLGVIAPSLVIAPDGLAEPSADAERGNAGSPGEKGSGLGVCRLLQSSNPITIECSSGTNGSSADGSESVSAQGGDEED
ncbi:hypothetical protein SAMN02982929_06036 [Saccharopolyspora kobensis]|uniref:Uncharacterized protein n=1 Tax=Saccharopolyspora kobensis TaxID=146035 RepID=A0A1H6ECF5_9PSEU|nr:hypothetical protein [Saccharopolyspora kobensis]SEG94953.1 hypothetical protein SAMN02982929_06036 [Saccharopolyspora kobensis]SFD61686.1 hypothetical protein SAMN05216506_105250 [Saccharopolyspora kobensis]